MPSYTVNVNGKSQTIEAQGDMPLLWVLRDLLGLTGSKYGCGIGACGACTVLVDGEEMRSCMVPISQVVKSKVVTIEGLSQDGTHPVQRAWINADVAQCGYCQAGHIMSAVALLKKKKNPTDKDIDAAFGDHVCRCGTYQRIREAIHAAARAGGSK